MWCELGLEWEDEGNLYVIIFFRSIFGGKVVLSKAVRYCVECFTYKFGWVASIFKFCVQKFQGFTVCILVRR